MIIPPIFEKFKISGFFSTKILKKTLWHSFPQVFFPKQLHSTKIIWLNEKRDSFSLEGDGVLTLNLSLTIGVQTADCLPILIGHKKKEILGAIHAGWRGTLQGILAQALQKILTLGFSPEDLLIAIGPHIQSSCYEVGEEVIDQLDPSLRKPPFLVKRYNHFYLNLSEINLYQARFLGIPKDNLWISSECTHCLREKYHSYRREKNYNYTQVAFIKGCPLVVE